MTVAALKPRNVVESLRDIIQDLLVPELKSIKVSIDSLHTEMILRNDKQTQAIQHISEKLDYTLDIRERLASLEARLPRN
jgi:Mg2+ and Co2+ transporter CorA